jgi:hypothetical protein
VVNKIKIYNIKSIKAIQFNNYYIDIAIYDKNYNELVGKFQLKKWFRLNNDFYVVSKKYINKLYKDNKQIKIL